MNSSNRNILGARQPDLCLIVTANPSWPDITNAIPSGSHWNHHPGIVASAFNFQINAFMRLTKSGHLTSISLHVSHHFTMRM